MVYNGIWGSTKSIPENGVAIGCGIETSIKNSDEHLGEVMNTKSGALKHFAFVLAKNFQFYFSGFKMKRSVKSSAQTQANQYLLMLMFTGLLSLNAVAYADDKTSFGMMGDTSYVPEAEPLLDDLIKSINMSDTKLAIHLGDIQGVQNCSLAYDQARLAQFNRSKTPIIYTPGDNEWSDCSNEDALEALTNVRSVFFPTRNNRLGGPGMSLGKNPITLMRQSDRGNHTSSLFDSAKFVENQSWIRSGIMFITLNIAGAPDEDPDACIVQSIQNGNVSYIGDATNVPNSCAASTIERQQANIAWLHQNFLKAKSEDVKGVIIGFQGDLAWFMSNHTPDGSCPPIGTVLRDGVTVTAPADPFDISSRYAACKVYEAYRLALRQEAQGFKKPVAIISGDRHYSRYFQPIIDTPNLTVTQGVGAPNLGWTRIELNKDNPNLFSFSNALCIPGPADVGLTPASNCKDTGYIKVISPSPLAGRTFETDEMQGADTPDFGKALVTLPNGIEGEVVYVGRGCPGLDAYLADPRGKIALIDRGVCRFDNKVARAQLAGAIAVLVANTSDAHRLFAVGNSPVDAGDPSVIGTPITIPALLIQKTIGTTLRSQDHVRIHIGSSLLGTMPLMEIHGD